MTERTYSVTDLTLQDANLILAALMELPIKHGGLTFNKVRQQLEQQEAAPAGIPVVEASPAPQPAGQRKAR